MLIIPAIDIKDGKVVRLIQGNFKEETVYSNNPVSIAKKWINAGAQLIHIVDLDGALTGEVKNFDSIKAIVENAARSIAIEVGGGIRDKETIERLFEIGVERVVLGTKVIEDRDFLKNAVDTWNERVVVGIDASDGNVCTKGWTLKTEIKAADFAKEVQEAGVKNIIYTDISKDGTLKGPNIEGIKDFIKSVNVNIIASGGVSCLDDIKILKSLESDGLTGVITGKALYEGKIDLREAIQYAG